jgi:hypothetical protein
VEEEIEGSETADSSRQAEGKADRAEDGKIVHIEGVEGVGKFVDKVTPPLNLVRDADEGPSGAVGGTESADELVLFVEKPVEQIDMGKERDTDKKHGAVERVVTTNEMGEPETLEIQPSAIMGAGKHHSVSPDWVLERVLDFCQELGLACDRHEEELLALFTTIKANRFTRKKGSGHPRCNKMGNCGDHELKRLECTVNYDAYSSTKVSGKRRNGKFC